MIAFSLFVGFVFLRRLGLDDSGPLSALLLLGAMAAAFTGGMFLKGKSGWCSTICPLLPVQRIYGQTPLLMVANAHCQPCVGCVKNCYDFNPRAAYLADLNDADTYWSGYRRYFVGAFPGLIVGFFVVPDGSAAYVLGWMAICVAAGVASFATLIAFWKTSAHTITSLYGAVAFSLFYWFASRILPEPLTWAVRAAAIALAVTWFVRTLRKEKPFHDRASAGAPAAAATIVGAGARSVARRASNAPEITFVPDNKRVAPKPGQTLLEAAEAAGMTIEAGCRMGVCGADPVAIKSGLDCTSPVNDDELATLNRLGYAPNTRMACCVKITGPVEVALTPDKAETPALSRVSGFKYDKTRREGRRDRQRDRGRDGRRPPAPPPPRRRDRPDRRGAAPPLQPDGHLAPRLRPLRDAGPLPQPRRLVRGAPDHRVAEHARARLRSRPARGGARHRRAAELRPADPRHRLEQLRAADRGVRGRRDRGPALGRRRDPPARLRPAPRDPSRRGRRRRAARPRGRVRAAQARAEDRRAGALGSPAAPPARRSRGRDPAPLPGRARARVRDGGQGRVGRRQRAPAGREPQRGPQHRGAHPARRRGHPAERRARPRGGAADQARRARRRADAHRRPVGARRRRRRGVREPAARPVADGGRPGGGRGRHRRGRRQGLQGHRAGHDPQGRGDRADLDRPLRAHRAGRRGDRARGRRRHEVPQARHLRWA